MPGFTLTARQRAGLEALCRRVVPAAYPDGDDRSGLAGAVEARLAGSDPLVRSRAAAALGLFASPAGGVVLASRPLGFAMRPAAVQDAWLRRMEVSAIPLRRTIFQAVRRLILSTWYAGDDVQRDLGVPGPLHDRLPLVAWEGPAAGQPGGDEPVLRTPTPVDAPLEAWLNQGHADPVAARAARLTSAAAPVTDGAALAAQVCVIGTGAGGAVAAARLAEAGFDVVVLEEGGWYTAADFDEREATMMPRLYADGGARATEDLSCAVLQGRCVGGGTTVNWMIMLRTPEWVLEEWAQEHGTEGMLAPDLAPVFDLVEAETHVGVVPDDAHSPNNAILLEGARRLGWSARAAAINARGCVRSGFCGLGCRYGAKQGTLVTYVPRALAAGARLVCDARAERIETVERGGAAPLKRVAVTLLDRGTGAPRGRITVEAPLVVLAGGAVGTPALLVRSGLGGGGVGRFLRLHPTSSVIGIHDRDVLGSAGIPLSAVCDEFLRRERGYGFWIECPPLLPALASVAVPGFGAAHRDIMTHYRSLSSFIVLVRDGADRRRSSGTVRVDRQGRPRLHYRMAPADMRHLVAGLEAAARIQFAAGATEVRTLHAHACRMRSAAELPRIRAGARGPNQLGLFSAHVNGTCRIGTRRMTSGCTPDGERHGARGLFVADGSLLPTAPGVNPQETIMALATVVARRIAALHRPG